MLKKMVQVYWRFGIAAFIRVAFFLLNLADEGSSAKMSVNLYQFFLHQKQFYFVLH